MVGCLEHSDGDFSCVPQGLINHLFGNSIETTQPSNLNRSHGTTVHRAIHISDVKWHNTQMEPHGRVAVVINNTLA